MIEASFLASLGGEIGFTDSGLVGYSWPVEGVGLIRLVIFPTQGDADFHPELQWLDSDGDVIERSQLAAVETRQDVRNIVYKYAAKSPHENEVVSQSLIQ